MCIVRGLKLYQQSSVTEEDVVQLLHDSVICSTNVTLDSEATAQTNGCSEAWLPTLPLGNLKIENKRLKMEKSICSF